MSNNPIVVFRVWQLLPVPVHLQAYAGALPRLSSAFDGQIWEMPGWTRASCSAKGGHVAPDLKCHCGLFGYFHLEDTHSMSTHYSQVLGAALAAGIVRRHERGLRAQYMKPIAFCSPAIPPQARRGPAGLILQTELDRQRNLMAQAEQDIRTLAGSTAPPSSTTTRIWRCSSGSGGKAMTTDAKPARQARVIGKISRRRRPL